MRLLEKNLSMDNYIRVYENVLNKRICDSVIEKFEKNKDQQEVVKDEGVSFTQIDFAKHDGWGFENKTILTSDFEAGNLSKAVEVEP